MDSKKEQLYKSMKIIDFETDNEPINMELIKKMKVEEYIEYQFNRQIELLNKYTEKKIQELHQHKNILKRELMDKNNQQINQLLNNSNISISDTDNKSNSDNEDQDQNNGYGEDIEQEEEFEFDDDDESDHAGSF